MHTFRALILIINAFFCGIWMLYFVFILKTVLRKFVLRVLGEGGGLLWEDFSF
nr:MAG TPA: hypothetical protein [Caudoviricetes sp.]